MHEIAVNRSHLVGPPPILGQGGVGSRALSQTRVRTPHALTGGKTPSPSPKQRLRLLIGHPCRLTGEVLTQGLVTTGEFAHVGLVHSLEQVSEAIAGLQPHVVLLAGLVGQPELALARQINADHGCGVVVVATEPSRTAVNSALRQGNISLLSHQTGLAHLLHAVRGTAMGCPTIDTWFAAEEDCSTPCTLTAREREVLLLTLQGLPIKELAETLFLVEGTVRNISSSAIRKLSARNRHEAARRAHNRGWL